MLPFLYIVLEQLNIIRKKTNLELNFISHKTTQNGIKYKTQNYKTLIRKHWRNLWILRLDRVFFDLTLKGQFKTENYY